MILSLNGTNHFTYIDFSHCAYFNLHLVQIKTPPQVLSPIVDCLTPQVSGRS